MATWSNSCFSFNVIRKKKRKEKITIPLTANPTRDAT